jgi:hypothetical protein
LLLGQDKESTRFDLAPSNVLDKSAWAALSKTDIRSNPDYFDAGHPWWRVLNENAIASARQLDRVTQIYGPYLDADTFELLSNLRTDEFLNLRLVRLDEFVKENQGLKFLPFPWWGDVPSDIQKQDPFGYVRFWKLVGQLDRVLYKDSAAMERRLLRFE